MDKRIPFKIIFILFGIILFVDVLALLFDKQGLHGISKLLLMPVLITYVISGLKEIESKNKKLLLLGLSLAWFGDLFLLLESWYPSFFILGLIFFLSTHICYILIFNSLSHSNNQQWMGRYKLLSVLGVFLYGILLYLFLFPYLGNLKIPVLIYALCITTMLLFSLRIKGVLKQTVWTWIFSGALLFVLSDSMLALNKFYAPFYPAPALIMLTYGLAQMAITIGVVQFCFSANHANEVPAE